MLTMEQLAGLSGRSGATWWEQSALVVWNSLARLTDSVVFAHCLLERRKVAFFLALDVLVEIVPERLDRRRNSAASGSMLWNCKLLLAC